LGEPGTNLGHEPPGFCSHAAPTPQPAKTERSAQFKCFRVLSASDVERLEKKVLGLGQLFGLQPTNLGPAKSEFTSEAIKLGLVVSFPGSIH
jgi:hypothetical protein